MPVIDQLRQFGETRRGWLGVRIQNVDDATAEALNLGSARGALVAGIDEKGPAKPAGLEVGDVIVEFDGKEVQGIARPAAHRRLDPGRQGRRRRRRPQGRGDDQAGHARPPGGQREAARPRQQPSTGAADADPAGARPQPVAASPTSCASRFSLKDDLKGVVVTRVDPNSAAADKRIQAGEVIVEVGQEPVDQARPT